jgi:hypothetical protein
MSRYPRRFAEKIEDTPRLGLAEARFYFIEKRSREMHAAIHGLGGGVERGRRNDNGVKVRIVAHWLILGE